MSSRVAVHHSRFVTELSHQVDVLLAGHILELVGAVVEEVLDAGGDLLVCLQLVLELQFALQLGQQLLVGLVVGRLSPRRRREGGGKL